MTSRAILPSASVRVSIVVRASSATAWLLGVLLDFGQRPLHQLHDDVNAVDALRTLPTAGVGWPASAMAAS
ncbi:hypothetical protein R6L23_01095 [Streptomyces sp. SR27]|uniref:hypothetical protein n=1 Tax=Streptomyces sp. SR27 TaxID=3076630 RepID=UPI00295B696C|nr:hypothetical protein [Streptomyces sp. SR27]MDV9186842.1 hypothetical protein [Streptomyces sp. SR27]